MLLTGRKTVEGVREREREKLPVHWFTPQMPTKRQRWARLNSATRILIQVSHVSGRDELFQLDLLLPESHISQKLESRAEPNLGLRDSNTDAQASQVMF